MTSEQRAVNYALLSLLALIRADMAEGVTAYLFTIAALVTLVVGSRYLYEWLRSPLDDDDG